MPLGVIGVVAIPFGLDWVAWWLMGLATEPVLAAARAVATLERSTMLAPAFGVAPLLLLVLSILWVTLWSTALRWLAVAPAALGVYLAATPQRADILVDRAAIGAAIRATDGKFALVGRPSGFVTEQWLKADGDKRKATDASLRSGPACDRLGCVVRLPGDRAVAFVADKRAFDEDCRRAAVIISRLAAPPTCKAALIVDRDRLSGTGSVAITAGDGGFQARNRTRSEFFAAMAEAHRAATPPLDAASIGATAGRTERAGCAPRRCRRLAAVDRQ